MNAPTNRDAVNPNLVAEAILVWLATEPGNDEADIALETALLTEGVMSPRDIVESFEGNADGSGVVMTLDNMDAFNIDAVTGAVTKLAE